MNGEEQPISTNNIHTFGPTKNLEVHCLHLQIQLFHMLNCQNQMEHHQYLNRLWEVRQMDSHQLSTIFVQLQTSLMSK